MPLPTIQNIDPVVVDPTPQRNYDAMYNTLIVSRYLDGKQNCRLGFKPYDSTAQVVSDTGEITVEIEDLFTEAASNPVVGEVLAAITALTGLYCCQKQLETKIDGLEDGEEKTAAQAQLDALNTTLSTTNLSTLLGA